VWTVALEYTCWELNAAKQPSFGAASVANQYEVSRDADVLDQCRPTLCVMGSICSGQFSSCAVNKPLQTVPTSTPMSNRPHNRQLPDRISRIADCIFTVRMLYRNMYRLLYILDLRFVLFLCATAVWKFAINEYAMLCYVMLGGNSEPVNDDRLAANWT